jgi:predicted TIM-barrel fold metal-dependent hydrolase
MIVDFQHHYTPPEMLGARQGEGVSVRLDENGNPSYLVNPLLADLDVHIRMMDKAGIDVAVLSSGAGFDNQDAASCRHLNDRVKNAEVDFPGRFIGLAHVPALKGKDAVAELERCKRDLGFPGVTIASELQGLPLDAPELAPFWGACERLGLYVFVHPLPAVINWNLMYADDLGRALGWEFSLMTATVRLINGGVLDRHPGLKVQFAHFCGGISRYLPRFRGFVQREKWGTAKVPNHNRRPARDYDHYLNERLMYDTGGWAGPDNAAAWGMEWIKGNLNDVPVSQVVFATDYPQAVRDDDEVADYVAAYKKLGKTAAAIDANATKLIEKLPAPKKPARVRR